MQAKLLPQNPLAPPSPRRQGEHGDPPPAHAPGHRGSHNMGCLSRGRDGRRLSRRRSLPEAASAEGKRGDAAESRDAFGGQDFVVAAEVGGAPATSGPAGARCGLVAVHVLPVVRVAGHARTTSVAADGQPAWGRVNNPTQSHTKRIQSCECAKNSYARQRAGQVRRVALRADTDSPCRGWQTARPARRRAVRCTCQQQILTRTAGW